MGGAHAVSRLRHKTKRHTRDFDQVCADIKSARHLELYKNTKDVEDLPGLGRHYCIECSKWFESEYNMKAHKKGKIHKRRLRDLKGEPHTQQSAEAAVGLGKVDNGKRSETVAMEMD
ncbi:Zinc finger protein bud20 [Penicillium taxi]|uniref:Zinc finger protein bud20 n=1 Tax=Penicillium taxi TaxID=168475 RepID=UPI0025457883|nr:Zinc finger protein bud20 [Penicillium taxi]KAJ5898795.1 Zinc finger protein bud20 [Penicillium taxi]